MVNAFTKRDKVLFLRYDEMENQSWKGLVTSVVAELKGESSYEKVEM